MLGQEVHIHDARTGEELFFFRTGSGFEGSAITYMFEGNQYVAIIGSAQNSQAVDAGDAAIQDERFPRGGSAIYIFALPRAFAQN